MIIARTRVWALAVTSQSARRSRYGRPSVREQRTGHCAARWRLRHGWQFGLLAGYGNMNTDFGNSTSSLVGFFAQLDAGSGGGAVLLDHVAFGHDERRGLRRVHRLQHAMGPTRPWLGSCLQGYAWGQFLPYAAVGIAVGRFNYQTSVTVTDSMTQLPLPGTSLGTFQQSADTRALVGSPNTGDGVSGLLMSAAILKRPQRFSGNFCLFSRISNIPPE